MDQMITVRQAQNIFIRVALILGWGASFAQPASLVPERLYVHFNQPFYAVGETIWYKVYCMNDTAEIQSRILYVDVIDREGNLKMQQKLPIQSGFAYGDFSIPLDWQEDYYLFRAYTQWNFNFGNDYLFTEYLPVYNEWHSPTAEVTDSVLLSPSTTGNSGPLSVAVETSQASFSPNASVNLEVRVSDSLGNPVAAHLSVSVLEQNSFPLFSSSTTQARRRISALPPPTSGATFRYSPEKTIHAQATIIDPTTKEPVTTDFLSVYLTDTQQFLDTSIQRGSLRLPFPAFYGNRTIQIYNINPFQPRVPIVTGVDFPWPDPEPFSRPALSRPPAVTDYLLQSKLRRKLQVIFYPESDPVPEDATSFMASLRPNQRYRPQDFQLIKTLEEFIDHVMLKVQILDVDERKSIRLFDPFAQQYFPEQPWYMINGFLTNREAEVLTLPLDEIEQIGIFTRKSTLAEQFHPLMLRHGVIALQTKEELDINPYLDQTNSMRVEGFYPARNFAEATLRTEQQPRHATPRFSPQVYWHPTASTDDRGMTTLTFSTNDAQGTFLVNVEAMDSQGRTGFAQTSYRVALPTP